MKLVSHATTPAAAIAEIAAFLKSDAIRLAKYAEHMTGRDKKDCVAQAAYVGRLAETVAAIEIAESTS